MCGVAGMVVPRNVELPGMDAVLTRMREAQRHRGPDDAGNYWNERTRVGLAANRLAIRDLTPAGHMPMCADGICITYNGEIYNTKELRAELTDAGAQFFSQSDTEVVLRGYIHWGEDVVKRLRGMFAFAIHDPLSGILLLARDPLGIKPLYYARGTPFCFASELRALIASGLVGRELDQMALSAYLQLGSIPAPLSIYRGVAAVLPGHCVRVRLRSVLELETFSYWSWPEETSDADVAEVRVALNEAVEAHMVSDVPVGAFLSGGLDSSAVTAIAAAISPEPLRTCSIAFESRRHDESSYARAVAKALGTEHHERLITRADFFGGLDRFVDALDQPSIDGFNTYFVAQTAAQAGLKVALSGLGGDELFGGYPSFRGVPRVLRVVQSARALAGGHAHRAINAFTRSDRWRKVAEATRHPSSPASAFLVYRGLFTRTETERMLAATKHFDAFQYVRKSAGRAQGNLSSWVGRAELGTYTTQQLLRDTDVMSMAHSLEVRVPLLDRRLLETVSALPAHVRFGGPGKPLLRRLMAQRLPALVLKRQARQGFAFPMAAWLRGADQRDLWQWDAPIFASFDAHALQRVQQRFREGRAHWSRVWALIALNEWSRRSARA